MKKNLSRYAQSAIWLTPGLKVKRWLFLTFTGIFLLALGLAIMFNLHPVNFSIQFLRTLATILPAELSGTFVIVAGFLLIFMGWKKANRSIFEAILPQNREKVLEALYRKNKLSRGPKIVAIGGGTGLSTILRGLKKVTNNLTAVVTVGDDGGSSGRLREEMGVLPPGDIRNCIAALADEEKLVTELFQYRFKQGEGLEGHSFGNLFLSALCAITGDMVSAVKESSNVLAIRGRVLPSTLDDMKLIAEMEDGRIINGESNIPKAAGKVKRIYSDPAEMVALPEVIEALEQAELIIMGPGSLYTSVIPNLLIPEIAKTISESTARKVYICNVMTQPGETDNYKASDHIKAILSHAGFNNIIEAVFVNDELSPKMVEKYSKEGSHPVEIDTNTIQNLGLKIVCKRLIQDSEEGLVRHSPYRISKSIQHWYKTGGFEIEKIEAIINADSDETTDIEIEEELKIG